VNFASNELLQFVLVHIVCALPSGWEYLWGELHAVRAVSCYHDTRFSTSPFTRMFVQCVSRCGRA
jgi:hypothetical protein